MAKYIVAVSGGVDSVVLLDMLTKTKHTLIVAHVDHGIRGEESASDARFVAALAQQYRLPFVSTELHLGAKASEEQARNGRYAFLATQAKKFGATIATAHHADDAIETVALNITRGTGWRGLAVLERSDIARPLLGLSKAQLYSYALKHELEWVEDATNQHNEYLRNRLRHKIAAAAIDTKGVLRLRAQQLQLRREIDRLAEMVADQQGGSRYFVTMLDDIVAVEVIGMILWQQVGRRPARPQLRRALVAIKTAAPGSVAQIGDGIELKFTARNYTVSVV